LAGFSAVFAFVSPRVRFFLSEETEGTDSIMGRVSFMQELKELGERAAKRMDFGGCWRG
jgi:hypothetical protein